MRKNIFFVSCLLFMTDCNAYLSTYLPVERIPPRPEYEGYDEHTLGQWHILQGYERKGVSYLEHAAQQGYMPAYRKLGDYYYYKLELPDRAIEYYTTAAQQGGDILALEKLAEIYYSQGNLQKAAEYYEELAQKRPAVWRTVSVIYEQLGNEKKAQEASKKYEEFHDYYLWHR